VSNSLLKTVFHERREGSVSKTQLKAKKPNVKRNRTAIEPSFEKPAQQGSWGIARPRIGLLCGLHLPFSSAPR